MYHEKMMSLVTAVPSLSTCVSRSL